MEHMCLDHDARLHEIFVPTIGTCGDVCGVTMVLCEVGYVSFGLEEEEVFCLSFDAVDCLSAHITSYK